MRNLISKLSKGLVGLTLALGVGAFLNNKNANRVYAGEAAAYTLDGSVAGTATSYAGDNAITQNSKSWKVNGNVKQVPWRIGGNKDNGLSSAGAIRKVQSQSVISTENISKVVVVTSKPSSGSISPTNVSLKVGTGVGGSQTSSLSNGSWASTVTFTRPSGVSWASKYFEIDFTMPANTTTTNKYIMFNSATFYYESSVTATSLSVSSVSLYPGHTANVTVSANPSGASLPASLKYTSLDTSVFTVSNGVVTGVAAGSATLKVEDASNSSVYGTSTVTVNAFPAVSRVTPNNTNKYAIYATSNGSLTTLNYSLSGVTSNVGTSTAGVEGSVDIDHKFEIVSGLYTNTVAIKTSDNKYLGYTAALAGSGNNNLNLINQIDDSSSWVVTDEQVIPARSYGTGLDRNLRFNYNSGNPRFACYISTSSVSTFVPISFYEIVVHSLTGISVSDASMYPGHEKTLEVHPVPAEANLDGATYTFSSATPSVATVDENGKVTAVSSGSSIITINASAGGNNYSTTATITVGSYPAFSGVTLNKTYAISGEFESNEYELTGIESNHGLASVVSGSLSFSFTFKAVAGSYPNSIAFEASDESGYLKSIKSGSNLSLDNKLELASSWVVSYTNDVYTIMSCETYGEASHRQLLLNKNSGDPRFGCYSGTSSTIFNIKLNESDIALTDFTLNDSAISLYASQSQQISVSYTPSNASDKSLNWSSSNTSVATVNNGLVTAVATGEATITASKQIGGNTVSRTCTVTVLANPIVHAGTALDPYNINEASLIAKDIFTKDANGNDVVKTGAYVKGIVTKMAYESLSSISFWIGDNASQIDAASGGFEIYNPALIMGKSVSERYSSLDDIEEDFAEGHVILATGNITCYHETTAEFAAGSNIVLNNYIEAKEFAAAFNTAITNGVCDADGATDQSDLASAWSTQSTKYSSLDGSTKSLFLAVAENGNENGNEIEHAVATYDYILKKYNTTQLTVYEDFMGRVSNNIVTLPASSNMLLVSSLLNESTNVIVVIVIISLVSITAIGGYFFLKKRREQN